MPTKIKLSNIYARLPPARRREGFLTLKHGKNFRIERIVSRGQATPKGTWLREKSAEWVIVLKGRACLAFKGSKKKFEMRPGDYLFIPANTRHRVDWTSPGTKTVWLAVRWSVL